jgi:ketosteroid isomerase-like protein
MKKIVIYSIVLFVALIFIGCEDESVSPTNGSLNNGIAQSIKDGDMDKLISYHAYGPKFTEFKNGAPRNGGEENEIYERNLFGSVTEVVKFDANDLKIAVYGDVANLTFHSDFQLKFGEDLVVVNNQITLLFVKTNDGWKLVHEHHSPLI